MRVDWDTIKGFSVDRGCCIQWVPLHNGYWLKSFDGPFELESVITWDRQDEVDDFEANFKTSGNKSPTAQVVTQFEIRDKTLKIAHGEAAVDATTGQARVLAKVPGTPGTTQGRWISSGTAFFDAHHSGDKVLSVRFIDHDNILGGGVDAVIGTYTDEDADEAYRGWVIPPTGWVKAEAIGGYGFAPSGFYIEIICQKATGYYTGTLYTNLEWGKQDG